MNLLCILLTLLCALPVDPKVKAMLERAERGDSVALWNMGLLYERGHGEVRPDSALALAFFRRSAQKGYAPALNYMGYRIYSGADSGAERARGIEMIRRAAATGDPLSCSNMGWLLIHGEGLRRDTAEGARMLRIGAMAGLPRAQVQYADLCRAGAGTGRDTSLADSLYEAALMAGLAAGGERLLELRSKDIESLPGDSAAALAKRYYASAYPALGVAYARRGAVQGSPLATAILADATSKGRGTPYDHDLSLRLYFEAAMLGDPSAQFVVAELLSAFPDALRDIAGEDCGSHGHDSAFWQQKAAGGGVRSAAEAMRRLGAWR